MSKPTFKIDSLSRDADLMARRVPADELFTWRTRTMEVPIGWIALAGRKERDPIVVASGERYQHDDTVDVLFIHTAPVTCTADASHLRSADDHACQGRLTLQVRVLPEAAELSAFRRTIVGQGDAVTREQLADHLRQPMRAALADLAGRCTAAELLNELDAARTRAAVDRHLSAACLRAGLALDGEAHATFTSPSYLAQQDHEALAAMQESRQATRTRVQKAIAAARNERLTHLANLLERMKQVAERHEGVELTQLIAAFSEAERGQLYSAMWRWESRVRPTRWIVAASGRELLYWEPSDFSAPARRVVLPEPLGLLRSVGTDERSLAAGLLLVGAATGVHLVEIETGEVRASLAAGILGGEPVRGGVNAIAMSDTHLFATHSELGLLAWPCDAPCGAPADRRHEELTRGAHTIRAARVAAERLWFSVDEHVWSADPRADADPVQYAGSRRPISALAVDRRTAWAGNTEGEILAWDLDQPGSVRIVRGRTGTAVESMTLVDSGGIERLIVADRRDALVAIVPDDSSIECRYDAGGNIVRRAAVGDDLLVAMNDARDRLLLWVTREPTAPPTVIPVAPLTGGRVQDVCLVTVCGD